VLYDTTNYEEFGSYETVCECGTAITAYPWNSQSELSGWSIDPSFGVQVNASSGCLYGLRGYSTTALSPDFAPSGLALTALLSPPAIQRIVAVSGSNVLQDRYASGALADILTSGIADNHPELVHVGAGGHHLGLVWQRSNDICITTGTGAPGLGGWPNTVQTVALNRKKPTACMIVPTHDVGVAYIDGSDALFARAAWANGSYVLGTETIISSGDVADERGQLLQTPGGVLLYVYRDSNAAVVIKESSNAGKTWS
jgi:hypothetical protein